MIRIMPVRLFPHVPRLLLVLACCVILGVFGYLLIWVAGNYRFPSRFDELQHLSVIRHQFENPDLFADASQYRMIDRENLSAWTEGRNYINHPPAYYILMSSYLHFTDSPHVARLINAALAFTALLIVLFSGMRLLPSTSGKVLFALLAACFPKAALVGGMVNNDNMAAICAALVFAGLTGISGGIWWLAIGVALSGWTKLTALIMLGTVVACSRLFLILSGKERWFSRDNMILVIAALVGALPYCVTFIQHGYLLYVNEAVWYVPPHERPAYDFFDFLRYFFRNMVMKWSASEFSLPWSVAVFTASVPLILTAFCLGSRLKADAAVRTIAACYCIALVVMIVDHIGFGWVSFTDIGDLTTAQTRYYNVLWPGFALAATVGLLRISRQFPKPVWPVVIVPVAGIFILPTLLGAMALLAWRVPWPAFVR